MKPTLLRAKLNPAFKRFQILPDLGQRRGSNELVRCLGVVPAAMPQIERLSGPGATRGSWRGSSCAMANPV